MTRSSNALRRAFPVLAMACIGAFAAPAQASGDKDDDADSQYEAAAMMHAHVYAATFVEGKCVEAFPAAKPRFEAAFGQWKRHDAKAMSTAARVWDQMEAASPRSDTERADDRRQAQNLWDIFQRQAAGDPVAVQRQCDRYLAAVAGGVWRKSSPRMYLFLEK